MCGYETYHPHMWGGGIKHNGKLTSIIIPRKQELSPIYGQCIGHLGQGVPVTTKLNLYLLKKKIFFDNIFFFTLRHIHAPQSSPLYGIFYIMLQECVHSGGISCIYMQGSMDWVDLYYNCLDSCMVSWGLCYNAIISNINAIYHIIAVMKLY